MTKKNNYSKPAKAFKTLGLSLGASTLSVVQLSYPEDMTKPAIIKSNYFPHDGNPRQTLIDALKTLNPNDFERIAITGRKFCKIVNLTTLTEPEAVEYAYNYVKPLNINCPAIISAGGETFMVYALNNSGKISNIITGNKCASGTGEFFLQQLRRMNVTLKEAAQWSLAEKPYPVSGRCSVFCKSDCTHATNKGIPKARVSAGLCQMMANKILELLKNISLQHVMITGGTTRNQMMINSLKKEIKDLIIPRQAPYFEALGAALWAGEHDTKAFPGISRLFTENSLSFERLEPLLDYQDQVEFKIIDKQVIQPRDRCIIGLDVGSTTTKAVLIREKDNALLCDIYLRTSGDPVRAARQCYKSLFDQVAKKIDPACFSIIGLGVCGSGRQIAGLHAFTDGIINEISAHAAAAVYFDPDVDTLFEIGGQDAKYTYITNQVPSDYAMNEACSAGTGSFLEESAFETLGIKMEQIAKIALKGSSPPNFNDQCAAFIASDIKNAIHEGVCQEDIVAGMVYSICMNYTNRVKANRPVGQKVFMQGGVCYNRAVPLAMAALVGKPIIVPPEPGLMGAFGVALVVKKRISTGLMEEKKFDLADLANRRVEYGKSFICRGGKNKCDRRCEIAIIKLEGQKIPFGGACNRYYNLRHKKKINMAELDLVKKRQHLVFSRFSSNKAFDRNIKIKGRIGFNRSFMVNTYFPLYSTFFSELGYKPVLPDKPDQKGIDQRNAAFCYPGELAHGFFYSLLQVHPPLDFIFLPHFKSIPAHNGLKISQVCPLVQGEPFYLKTAFRKKLEKLEKAGTRVLTPLLDLTKGLYTAEKPLIESAREMGINRKAAKTAFDIALAQQTACLAEMQNIGQKTLSALEKNPEQPAIIIFGRPYNGFVKEAHMGIPDKFASRGIRVIPFDFLSVHDQLSKRHMYWGMGQLIMMAARIVKKHPQLFGTYITNFSCGPDSFLIGYFRDIMGRKPSLTLELDSHTADAGIETRIEAFLDIIASYHQLSSARVRPVISQEFQPAKMIFTKSTAKVQTSDGKKIAINDPKVTLLLPSMGKLSSEGLAAVFRGAGLNAKAHKPPDKAILKLGRGNTSCKECLPLILTTGTLLQYINQEREQDEIVVYFMPTGSGPCRFGQYRIFMEDLVKKLELKDVALFSLSSENGYKGLGKKFHTRAFNSMVISDLFEDIRSMILANARDLKPALKIFNHHWQEVLNALQYKDFTELEKIITNADESFSSLSMKRAIEDVPLISLTGEIFVRRDGLSRQYLTERLAKNGFAVSCTPVTEWLHYTDYLVKNGLVDNNLSFLAKLKFWVSRKFLAHYEKRLYEKLSHSGLLISKPINIDSVIENSRPYISHHLAGEAVLTVGGALSQTMTQTCGVIAIGPFGCMPNRISEAILSGIMERTARPAREQCSKNSDIILTKIDELPFLAIETDGSPFPQLIDAKLEAFCLRAERLHEKMQAR